MCVCVCVCVHVCACVCVCVRERESTCMCVYGYTCVGWGEYIVGTREVKVRVRGQYEREGQSEGKGRRREGQREGQRKEKGGVRVRGITISATNLILSLVSGALTLG